MKKVRAPALILLLCALAVLAGCGRAPAGATTGPAVGTAAATEPAATTPELKPGKILETVPDEEPDDQTVPIIRPTVPPVKS